MYCAEVPQVSRAQGCPRSALEAWGHAKRCNVKQAAEPNQKKKKGIDRSCQPNPDGTTSTVLLIYYSSKQEGGCERTCVDASVRISRAT